MTSLLNSKKTSSGDFEQAEEPQSSELTPFAARKTFETSDIKPQMNANTVTPAIQDNTNKKVDSSSESLIDKIKDRYEASGLTSAEAKKEFFLKKDHLRDIPYNSLYLGFASGPPTHYYRFEDVLEAAQRMHGPEGLEKKLRVREKREANKRKREEEAEKAKEEIARKKNKTGEGDAGTSEITNARATLLRMAKASLHFDNRYSRTLHAAPWRIELHPMPRLLLGF
jgi:glutamine synthetase